MSQERRQYQRINTNLPIELKVDAQITVQGQIKNLTEKGAFIQVKSGVHIQVHDEFEFGIKVSRDAEKASVTGKACVSRIDPGQGMAIYFVGLSEAAQKELQVLLGA